MIPYYLLTDIFKYLESDEQRQLRLVSKKWNEFLLPFVFKRLSTEMYDGFEELLRKYSNLAKELYIYRLDVGMCDLISACKNATRLFINLSAISPEAALQLGESFPLLSYLEIYYGDSAKVSYLSPLTRKVQTLYYRPVACDDTEEFMTYYKDFDCPLVTHLIIDEEWVLAGYNFAYIIKRFPALKTFDYTGPNLDGYQFDHFVYDVENVVFKEISFGALDPIIAFLRFKDDIPAKTPLLFTDQEVTHKSQFDALLSTYIGSSYSFIAQFSYLDAVDVNTGPIGDKEFIDLILGFKDIRSLSFEYKYHELQFRDLALKLGKNTFKATTLNVGVDKSEISRLLDLLADYFPKLEELSICVLSLPYAYDRTKKASSKSMVKFWKKLVKNCPNLSRIHLPNGTPLGFQIEKNYPHILVDNKCKPRYYKRS